MSLTLELSPERERRLKSFAERQGKRESEVIEAWIDTVIDPVPEPQEPERKEIGFTQADLDTLQREAERLRETPEAWLAAFRAFTEANRTHSVVNPTDSTFSREEIYGDHP